MAAQLALLTLFSIGALLFFFCPLGYQTAWRDWGGVKTYFMEQQKRVNKLQEKKWQDKAGSSEQGSRCRGGHGREGNDQQVCGGGMTSIKASLSLFCAAHGSSKRERERERARMESERKRLGLWERREEWWEIERENSKSSAPLRADDGFVSLTSAADGRRGPSGPLNVSSSSTALFYPSLHLLLFSPVLLPRRLDRLIGCPMVPDFLQRCEKCRRLRPFQCMSAIRELQLNLLHMLNFFFFTPFNKLKTRSSETFPVYCKNWII